MRGKSVAYVGRGIAAIGMLMMLSVGCSKKALQADGAVSALAPTQQEASTGEGYQSSAGQKETYARGDSQAAPNSGASSPEGTSSSDVSHTGISTEQRLVPDPTPNLSMVEPGRLAAEEQRRAEEAATAAAGFQDVFFDFDSFSIPVSGQQALIHDAAWMKAHPERKVRIEGQCDERGTQAYNHVLGEKRARGVERYLKDLGVVNELSVISLGKDRPWCSDRSESCYQQNRRGHLVIRVD